MKLSRSVLLLIWTFEWQAELFEGLHCQPGAMVSRKQLSEDLTTLLS
jgi:hypothetical protein